ncbi:phosphoglycerate mutase [Plasmopara halstedii]|uniref:Serine/threonine-protein phosphatase PGAM5, mitochondrial n=1 Tax=Plasmopara halstedii TaxID=4781 RepID=A0A0P1B7R0_PLAHL|nr:phosphoglycerate mutase [Plasmopara halstedii]CEG50406.1 phosphoglycerate mutase [Plasmopara halstedii]|eukprot:XP_024586775.1 phosphoglycerate mutase [Plasmopara halstedii]
MELVSPAQSEEGIRPSHMLNSRLSNVNHFSLTGSGMDASRSRVDSQGARTSLMSSIMHPSSMMRPTVVTDLSNHFSESKLHDARVQIFSKDVLMESQLTKKGETGLQSWKNRIFVLRGQELSYYTIDNKQRYGALKGTWNVAGASVERQDNLSISIKLANGSVRTLGAPNVQILMDWMTAIAVAAEAFIVEPTSDLSLVDQSRTTHIILVRHGHYTNSQTPSIDMHGPLTELGVDQARATGLFLQKYLSDRMVLKRYPRFPVYHSGIRRAVETAEHIASAFPPGSVQFLENKLFREAWPGNPLPNSNRQQLAREKLDNMVADCARLKLAYRTMFRHLIPQDLEIEERRLSEEDQKVYMDTFGVRSTQTRMNDRFRVVVCHANIIRWFVCKALGVDPDGTWGRMRYNHCGLTAMEVDSVGNVQLTYMNQTGHLETTQLSEV